jgi:hypothetical protein
MKTSFDLTLFDDWETERKLEFLNRLETLFDHTKNTLPNEYYQFSDNLPIGSKVRVTFEVIEE